MPSISFSIPFRNLLVKISNLVDASQSSSKWQVDLSLDYKFNILETAPE